jgi:urea transporter
MALVSGRAPAAPAAGAEAGAGAGMGTVGSGSPPTPTPSPPSTPLLRIVTVGSTERLAGAGRSPSVRPTGPSPSSLRWRSRSRSPGLTPSGGSLTRLSSASGAGGSPRPSGAGGYAPPQRVLVASISSTGALAAAGLPHGHVSTDSIASLASSESLTSFRLDATAQPSPRPSPPLNAAAAADMVAVVDAVAAAPADEEEAELTPSSRLMGWLTGTAPCVTDYAAAKSPALDFVNCCLRGIGQVCFMNNPLTGLIILLALCWQSLYCATMGVLGLTASTGFALALELDRGAIRSGLFGFNGVLVGLALATFDRGCQAAAADCQEGLWQYAAVGAPVVLMAMFSTLFSVSLGNFLVPVYSVPSFTLPFNCAAILFFGAALESHSFPLPFRPALLAPNNGSLGGAPHEVDWGLVFEAVPKGIGQVFLADDTASGLLIGGALFLCSPIAGLMAVWGSVLGTALALVLQVPTAPIYAGLWGYNAVLGTMAVGGMFFYPNPAAFLLATMCGAWFPSGSWFCSLVVGSIRLDFRCCN